MKYFLTGHGGWTPADGFFSLPSATTVTFYTENAKLMLASDVYQIVEGVYRQEPSHVIQPFHNCQNMTLYPDDDGEIQPTLAALSKNPNGAGCDVIRVTAPMKLKDIVAAFPASDFVWACCRDLSLRPAGNNIARDAGVNAAQTGGKYINFDKNTWALDGGAYAVKWRVRYKKAWAF
jgi:hypothetical protein